MDDKSEKAQGSKNEKPGKSVDSLEIYGHIASPKAQKEVTKMNTEFLQDASDAEKKIVDIIADIYDVPIPQMLNPDQVDQIVSALRYNEVSNGDSKNCVSLVEDESLGVNQVEFRSNSSATKINKAIQVRSLSWDGKGKIPSLGHSNEHRRYVFSLDTNQRGKLPVLDIQFTRVGRETTESSLKDISIESARFERTEDGESWQRILIPEEQRTVFLNSEENVKPKGVSQEMYEGHSTEYDISDNAREMLSKISQVGKSISKGSEQPITIEEITNDIARNLGVDIDEETQQAMKMSAEQYTSGLDKDYISGAEKLTVADPTDPEKWFLEKGNERRSLFTKIAGQSAESDPGPLPGEPQDEKVAELSNLGQFEDMTQDQIRALPDDDFDKMIKELVQKQQGLTLGEIIDQVDEEEDTVDPWEDEE